MKTRKRKSGRIPDDDGNDKAKHLEVTDKVSLEVTRKPVLKIEKLSMPVPKKIKTNTPPKITPILKSLGNSKAWIDLIQHLTGNEKHKPLLIYGPVGVGKTLGVQDIFKICNLNCTILDGSAPENPSELDMWISQIRDNNVLEGNGSVLFIDDIESFTIQCRDVIIKHIQQIRRSKSPIVVSCTDFYSYDLKDFTLLFRDLPVLRLYSPNNEIVTNWLKTKGYNINIIKAVSYECKGDLRASENSLKFFYYIKQYESERDVKFKFNGLLSDKTYNIFELANSLILNKNDRWFDIFSSNGETSHWPHIRILYENLLSLVYEPSRIRVLDPLQSYDEIMNLFSFISWDSLPEIVTAAGMMCRQKLQCKYVSKKWSLPTDRTNIRPENRRETTRNIMDSFISRSNKSEKSNMLYDFMKNNMNPDKIPCMKTFSEEKIDSSLKKINPIRLGMSNHNSWEVPSVLGGLKLSI